MHLPHALWDYKDAARLVALTDQIIAIVYREWLFPEDFITVIEQ